MRFKFCGDLDAPDWVLAEINVLSKFVHFLLFFFFFFYSRYEYSCLVNWHNFSSSQSSVRMKLLCRQVLDQLFGRGINVRVQSYSHIIVHFFSKTLSSSPVGKD
jgi:hypothetical protein